MSHGISKGNITGRKKKEINNKTPHIMCLLATPRGEAAQMLTSTTCKRRLDREVRAALLRVRTGPECPEGNLRELTRDSNPDCGIAIPGKVLT